MFSISSILKIQTTNLIFYIDSQVWFSKFGLVFSENHVYFTQKTLNSKKKKIIFPYKLIFLVSKKLKQY